MIAFEERLGSEIKEAMRAKDQVRLDCLRAMKSALKYKSVEKAQADVSEEEAIAVFQTMIKQRRDSVDQFTQFGRTEQAAKETKEIEVITAFLPQQLTEGEVKALIVEAIKTTGSVNQRDLGKVMKDLKPKISGRADGKIVTEIIKTLLPAA